MKDNKLNIIFSHLLNDYSGSPFVLSQVVNSLLAQNYKIKLFLGNKKRQGFLSGLDVKYTYAFYTFKENKLLRLLFLFGAQFSIFIKIIFTANKRDCKLIYSNTLYSFGAALAGKLKGIKVIYHIHETSLKPKLLKQFLVFIAKKTSSLNIFVSKHHMQLEKIDGIPSIYLYNSINPLFYKEINTNTYNFNKSFVVLMICSLKDFKGIYEFVEIAQKLKNSSYIKFQLVLNAEKTEINKYFIKIKQPNNLQIYASQQNLIPFYKKANLVLNLSHPDKWIETFGLTILEAMTFGVPVIGPTVGGPTELINNGKNGYLISCYETDKIANKIIELSENKELCYKLSKNAKEKAMQFSPSIFKEKIIDIINEK